MDNAFPTIACVEVSVPDRTFFFFIIFFILFLFISVRVYFYIERNPAFAFRFLCFQIHGNLWSFENFSCTDLKRTQTQGAEESYLTVFAVPAACLKTVAKNDDEFQSGYVNQRSRLVLIFVNKLRPFHWRIRLEITEKYFTQPTWTEKGFWQVTLLVP